MQPGGQGSFWAGRRLGGEPQTLWPDEGGETSRQPWGGLLATLAAPRMGRQADFQVGMRGVFSEAAEQCPLQGLGGMKEVMEHRCWR